MAICQAHKPSETHLESVTEKGDRSKSKTSYDPVCGKWGQVRTTLILDRIVLIIPSPGARTDQVGRSGRHRHSRRRYCFRNVRRYRFRRVAQSLEHLAEAARNDGDGHGCRSLRLLLVLLSRKFDA